MRLSVLALLVVGVVAVVTVSMYDQIASMNEIHEAASFCNKPKTREEGLELKYLIGIARRLSRCSGWSVIPFIRLSQTMHDV